MPTPQSRTPEYRRARYRALLVDGLCPGCGGSRDSDRTLCAKCRGTRKKATDKYHRIGQNQLRLSLWTKYRMTLQQHQEMTNQQGGKCAICQKTKKLVVDHCHGSRRIRGLLCDGCNRAIGFFHEDVKAMQAAIEYLRKHRLTLVG